MASFDIVNEPDLQEVDNAVTQAVKEVGGRFDFKGSNTLIELNKKDMTIKVETEDDMKLKAIQQILVQRFVARKLSPKLLDFQKPEPAASATLRMMVKLRKGLETDVCRDIVKRIKALNPKIQASIQGDSVRVTAKQIDDLQSVIQMLNAAEDIPVPLNYNNMKR